MSSAFFGKGFGSLCWTVVANTAPKEIIGVTSGVFNAIGNTVDITTPIVIGCIVAGSGSFNGALVFVGAHWIVTMLSYWLIVGRIEGIDMTKLGGQLASTSQQIPQSS